MRILAGLAGLHLAVTAIVAFAYVARFGHHPLAAAAHVLLVATWDVAMVGLLTTMMARRVPDRRAFLACALLPAVLPLLQLYLYTLHFFSNVFWGRNITLVLVEAYLPTVLSGHEPLPFGRGSLIALVVGGWAMVAWLSRRWAGGLAAALRSLSAWLPVRLRVALPAGVSLGAAVLFGGTLAWGVPSDWAVWNTEMIASFLRPHVIIFEPTLRRRAVGDRDEAIAAGYPRAAAGSRRNVALIVVDSLRADRMHVYGYHRPTTPFLSGMVAANRLRRVDVALSTCSESYCGLTSLLSSREFRDITPRAFTLPAALYAQGYDTRFIMSSDDRGWYGMRSFYADHATSVDDASGSAAYPLDDDRIILDAIERLPAAGRRPAFFYIHMMSAHATGVQLDAYRRYGPLDEGLPVRRTARELFHHFITPNRYDDRVTQADDMIRQIFDALSRKGYLDDALVVVTSDHGEGLGERHYGHGFYLYQEDIRIPLLIADTADAPYPGLPFATHLDVAPTILARLGLPVPPTWTGRSLTAPAEDRFTVHQTNLHPVRHAVVHRRGDTLWQLIVSPTGDEELYELTQDPAQSRNLVADAPPGLLDQMRARLRAYRTDGG